MWKALNIDLKNFKTYCNEGNTFPLHLCTTHSLNYQFIDHKINPNALHHLNDWRKININTLVSQVVFEPPSNINATTD